MAENRISTLNVGDIQGGMDVFGLDGVPIGHVTDVWLSPSDASTPNVNGPVTVTLPPDPSPIESSDVKQRLQSPQVDDMTAPHSESSGSATIDQTSASVSYFTVEGDEGLFYVPFGAVTTLFPGQNVTIDCTRTECKTRYREIPG